MTPRDKLLAIITKLLNPKHPVTDDTTLKSLGADSLDEIELAMDIEAAFGILVPDEAALEWKTVGDILRFVERAAELQEG